MVFKIQDEELVIHSNESSSSPKVFAKVTHSGAVWTDHIMSLSLVKECVLRSKAVQKNQPTTY